MDYTEQPLQRAIAVADPAGQPIDVVRAIRDDITQRVRTLLGTFTPATPA